MPNPTQPGVLPIWTQGNGAARVQPSNGEQFTGFYPNFRPPSSWHNWLFGVFSDWIAWLNFITSPAAKTGTGTASLILAQPMAVYLGNPAGGSYGVAFPSAAANAGYGCTVKNISATNNLTVSVALGDSLEGTVNGTVTVGPGECYTFASDGSAGYWQVNS